MINPLYDKLVSKFFFVVISVYHHRVSHLSCKSSQCPSEVHNTAVQGDKMFAPSWPVSPSVNTYTPGKHILNTFVSPYLNEQLSHVLSLHNEVLKHSIWNISYSMSPYVEQASGREGWFLSPSRQQKSQGSLFNQIYLWELWCRHIRKTVMGYIFILLLLIPCKQYGEGPGKHISHQFIREVSKSFAGINVWQSLVMHLLMMTRYSFNYISNNIRW